jgi:hypothetical protein
MPGVRVTSVRRTVVVAVALVTGQALLCGIIGFVTFGDRGGAAPPGRAAEPQLAGPPIVVPPPSVRPSSGPAERPGPRKTRSPRTERPTSPAGPAAGRNATSRAVSPSRTTTAPVAPPPPAPVTSPTDRALLPPVPPAASAPEEDAPVPVVEKERCEDEGATGSTAEGGAVRCERARDGELRWRLVQ